MSAKFRPINRNDIPRMAPSQDSKIKSSPMKNLNSANSYQGNVMSDSIFGKKYRGHIPGSDEKEYEDEYTRVGYIELTKRILNPFVAGRKAPIWRKLLECKEDVIMDIIEGMRFYDLHQDKEVELREVGSSPYDPERFIFGADYLMMLLKNVNFKKRLERELFTYFIAPVLTNFEKSQLPPKGELNWGEIVTISKEEAIDAINGNVPGWFFNNFRLDLSQSDFDPERRSEIEEKLFERVNSMNVVNMAQYPLITLISDIIETGSLERLESQIMDYVFVLPRGYRDSIDNRVDPISSQYNKLVNSNNDLNDILNQKSPNCYSVMNKYKECVELLRNIFIGDPRVIARHQLGEDYKSLSDTITGKKGLMRGRMQAARVDNSGRSVITCDPDMPIDTIGIPKKLLYKIAEPAIIRDLRKYKPEDGQNLKLYGRNLARFSTTSSKEKDGITYEEFADLWFKQQDRYGVTGRQPTLFYLGIQGFKVLPVEGDSIVLSPLVVMPFNADFDGDQMHYNMPITPEAEKEVRERMASVNNLRYPKNGEITVVTRHEIIYGLWVAGTESIGTNPTKYSNDGIRAIGSRLGLAENSATIRNIVYDAVCKQLIGVHDLVEYKGEYIRAGIVALQYAMLGNIYSMPYLISAQDIKDYLKSKHIDTDGSNRNIHQKISNAIEDSYEGTNWNMVRNIVSEVVSDNSLIEELMKYLYSGFSLSGRKITAKLLNSITMKAAGTNSNIFLSAINRLVKLGFSVAKIWPPNISTIVSPEIVKHIDTLTKDFNERIMEREELLNVGIEIESEFTAYFNREWKKLQDTVNDYLEKNLSIDNGYIAMWKSGGKGGKDNIQQIFGIKGRVQKNDITAFNSIISGSYAGQLTGLEHGVTAYGSRKGLADKVLATAEPGYMSRKLEHAGSTISIVSEDCGTMEGMKIGIEDIVPFLDESQISVYGAYPAPGESEEAFYSRTETKNQYYAAREYLSKLIVGRYCVMEGRSNYIEDVKDAIYYIESSWGCYDKNGWLEPIDDGYLVLRSPVYCKKPCCSKCYGDDITQGRMNSKRGILPKMGRPIGFIAAQAIGEPGTQMTMKNFQKGGVVSEANLTSAFESIEDYFELHNLKNKRRDKRGAYTYDVISPVAGYVKEQYVGNGTKLVLVTKTDNEDDRKSLIHGSTKIIVPAETKLKNYVNVGDSFQEIQGDLNMKEVLKYRGYDKAVSYLCFKLHNIFSSQDVSLKHFEAIAAAMTVGYVLVDIDSDPNGPSRYGKGSEFKAGTIMTRTEMCLGNVECNAEERVHKTLLGLKALPKYKADFLESILMESMDSYIPRAMLYNPNDSMTNPIALTSFGLPIGIGSDLE